MAILINCNKISNFDYLGFTISSSVFSQISSILTLGVFAYSLVCQFFKIQSRNPLVPRTTGGILITLTAIIWFPYIIMLNWIRSELDLSYVWRPDNLTAIINAHEKLGGIYLILYLITSVVAFGFLTTVLFSTSTIQNTKQAKIWTMIASITFMSVNLVAVVDYFLFGITFHRLDLAGSVIIQIFFMIYV